MKHSKFFLFGCASLLFAGATVALLSACDDEQFEGSIAGVAILDNGQGSDVHTVVHNGDNVRLVVGAAEGAPMSIRVVRISGIDYAPDVHYLIDGTEVGASHDFESAFAMPYVVTDLSAGTHTLSVRVDKDFGNIDYVVNIAPSTFVVQ